MSEELKIEFVPINSVHPAEWNVRIGHDVDQIAESIRINGLRSPIGVWRETGDIVKGTGCWHAMKKLGYSQVPVVFHDFPDRQAAQRYSIADNRVAELSRWDYGELTAQLSSLTVLDGTGFAPLSLPETHPDLTTRLPQPATHPAQVSPEREWEGMPEFKHEDQTPWLTVHVHLASQADLEAFSEAIGQAVPKNTHAVWYPRREQLRMTDEVYTDVEL